MNPLGVPFLVAAVLIGSWGTHASGRPQRYVLGQHQAPTDVCSTKMTGNPGDFAWHMRSVQKGKLVLDFGLQPAQPLKSGQRALDGWSLWGLKSKLYWGGLVYAYRHGNNYHACGTGTAMSDWQAAGPGSGKLLHKKHFSLNESVTPHWTTATLRLGRRTFRFSGKTGSFRN